MNPAGFSEQVRRAWAIAKKDIRIYYFKGPVLIFGIFMPVFLFLAFLMGTLARVSNYRQGAKNSWSYLNI